MRSWSKWKIFSRKWKSSSSAGTALADPQGVLVVGDRARPAASSAAAAAAGDLVRLAPPAALDCLLAVLDRLAAVMLPLLLIETSRTEWRIVGCTEMVREPPAVRDGPTHRPSAQTTMRAAGGVHIGLRPLAGGVPRAWTRTVKRNECM